MSRKRLRPRQGGLALSILFLITACSTTDYQKPVDDFAAATTAAETALSQLNSQVTAAYKQVLDDSILNGKLFVRTADENCLTASKRCRLVAVTADNETEPYPPEPPLTQMTLVMSGVKNYALNLKALLEADTARQVETQVNAALGSIQNLAETVAEAQGGAQPTEVPNFATPTGTAVNWIVGQYVESVKLRGLRQATASANGVIKEAASLFSVTSDFISDVPRSELAEEVSKAVDTFREASSKSNLATLAMTAAKYDELLTSTPPQLFERLGTAHDALANSLQDEGVTLAMAIARIEDFADEAQKLAKILKDLRAIGAGSEGG